MSDWADTAAIDAFRRDGVVHIAGIFADWVERLAAGVAQNLASPGPDGKLYRDRAGRLFMSDYCNWQRIAAYEDFLRHSRCGELAAALMGAAGARLFHEHVLVKEAGAELPTPWHHDQPYYCVDGRQNVSIWIPLDPVGRDSSPEFVAGSHQWGRHFTPRRFDARRLRAPARYRGPPLRLRHPRLHAGRRRCRLLPLSHRPRRAGQPLAHAGPARLFRPLAGRRRPLRPAPRPHLAALPRAGAEAGRGHGGARISAAVAAPERAGRERHRRRVSR